MTLERCVPLPFAPRPHEARIGRGLLARLGAYAADVVPPGACVLVTEPTVAATPCVAAAQTSLEGAGFRPVRVLLPPGEAAKTAAEVEALWDAFAAADIDRRSLVVAMGGGAVGDAAGFAAATWLRGVPLMHVPTTVLAMADSSIGGKTGVNRPAGKNLVGAVHQPELVLADVDTLATLPDRELRSGFAEVAKCAVLADRSRLAGLREAAPRLRARDPSALVEWIAFAVEVKSEHVRGDPLDTLGTRALLNLGHTTAHALETASGHGTMLHGEAVAVGLVVAARIAVRRGLCDPSLESEIAATLAAFGLPTAVPAEIPAADVVARTRFDKKRAAGRRRMVLPHAAGGAGLHEVGDDELAAGL